MDESKNKGDKGKWRVQGLLSEAQEETIHRQGWDNRETRAGWNFRSKVHQTPADWVRGIFCRTSLCQMPRDE
jgi:hypothetical protein